VDTVATFNVCLLIVSTQDQDVKIEDRLTYTLVDNISIKWTGAK
jgi:hypothetical protein